MAADADPASAPRFPLALARCSRCRLVQLESAPAPETLAASFLAVRPAVSAAAVDAVADRLEVLGARVPGALVVDAAFSHGTIAAGLVSRGFEAVGLDPFPGAEPARPGLLDVDTARHLRAAHGPARCVLLRHVIGHGPSPHVILAGAESVLAADGRLLIVTPDALSIVNDLAYDLVFHEHVLFFDARSLRNLLSEHGLTLIDAVTGEDGMLWAVAARQGMMSPELRRRLDGEAEADRNWQTLAARITTHASTLWGMLERFQGEGARVWGYPAAARAMALALISGLRSTMLEGWADANPRKHGLRCPGTGIPVSSPARMLDAHPDVVFVGVRTLEPVVRSLVGTRPLATRLLLPFPTPEVSWTTT